MTTNQPTIVKFKHEKDTPGTFRYQEVDDDGNKLTASEGAVIGNLYLRKTALGGEKPLNLTVTITAQ